jgi:hypothetical protein
MDAGTVVSLGLSAVAIVVSGGVGIAQYVLQRRVAVIERERRGEELEARGRAEIAARFDPPGNPNYLVLINEGAATAHDVALELHPATILLHGEPRSFQWIESGQEVHVRVSFTRDDFPGRTDRVVCGRIRWHDDRGPHEKELALTP